MTVTDGLNRLVTVGGTSAPYDGKGNLTTDPVNSKTLGYWTENALASVSGGATIYYDPIGRLAEYDTSVSTRFMSDGVQLAVEIDNPAGAIQKRWVWGDGPDRLAEYDGSNNLLRRYVVADGIDQPIVWYEGSGTSDRRFLGSDERGSIVSVTDSSGTVLALNKYDEFGQPQTTNIGVWGYTGQAWLPWVGVWYYKARVYDPELRFLQPDPIGYADSANLYPYALNDPVNLLDPLGLEVVCSAPIGSRIGTDCVAVDGDGDGLTSDNDLGLTEANRIRESYAAFISGYGTPSGIDISGFGKPVIGSASAAGLTSVRVATQFVGAAIAFGGYSGLQSAWDNVGLVIAKKEGQGTTIRAAWTCTSCISSYIGLSGSGGRSVLTTLYGQYSDLARALLHETYHGIFPTPTSALHLMLDQRARATLMRMGLGGGGCVAISGFPGC